MHSNGAPVVTTEPAALSRNCIDRPTLWNPGKWASLGQTPQNETGLTVFNRERQLSPRKGDRRLLGFGFSLRQVKSRSARKQLKKLPT